MRFLVGFWLPTVVSSLLAAPSADITLFPLNGQQNVNPDTHLVLKFASPPKIGSSGTVRVYDAADERLIDVLDLAIPTSPSPYGNGSNKANYSDTTTYQTNVIGGMDFYFFPVLVRGNTATFYLHANRLEYNRTYLVTMDPGVLVPRDSVFLGFNTSTAWRFSTKTRGPPEGATTVTVSADGSGDFNTVQGAIDWAPANPAVKTVILIRDGDYEELVYFQYKSNLVLRGESPRGTRVSYPNNASFNPPGRQGPSRRPAFSFRGVADVQLSSFTITNSFRGQAEALLSDGVRVVLDRMTLNGSGDALTTYGTLYVADTTLHGDGDTVLGYASAFWTRSTIVTRGPATWTRTSQGSHGNVLVNCTVRGKNSTFARLPDNKGGVLPNWPYAEMVLMNTRTEGIAPVGWGPVQGPPFDARHVRFWEFNTTDLQGRAVDMSRRLKSSRQLNIPSDAQLLAQYAEPSFVLGGWTPVVV